MNWAQFRDPVSHRCLAGAVVASWTLTQEVAGLSPSTVMTNIFVTEFSEFREKIRENSNEHKHRGSIANFILSLPTYSFTVRSSFD